MFVLLEVSPISTQDLWSSVRVTIGFLVTSLTKALLLRLLSLAVRKKILCSPPQLPRHNPVGSSFDLMIWPVLICIVSCETFYRQVCAFPNPVQSIECTTSGPQIRWRNISKMIKRNGRHLSYISKGHSKGSEYLCQCGI